MISHLSLHYRGAITKLLLVLIVITAALVTIALLLKEKTEEDLCYEMNSKIVAFESALQSGADASLKTLNDDMEAIYEKLTGFRYASEVTTKPKGAAILAGEQLASDSVQQRIENKKASKHGLNAEQHIQVARFSVILSDYETYIRKFDITAKSKEQDSLPSSSYDDDSIY